MSEAVQRHFEEEIFQTEDGTNAIKFERFMCFSVLFFYFLSRFSFISLVAYNDICYFSKEMSSVVVTDGHLM